MADAVGIGSRRRTPLQKRRPLSQRQSECHSECSTGKSGQRLLSLARHFSLRRGVASSRRSAFTATGARLRLRPLARRNRPQRTANSRPVRTGRQPDLSGRGGRRSQERYLSHRFSSDSSQRAAACTAEHRSPRDSADGRILRQLDHVPAQRAGFCAGQRVGIARSVGFGSQPRVAQPQRRHPAAAEYVGEPGNPNRPGINHLSGCGITACRLWL